MNDRLVKVRLNEDIEVPIESNSNLWLLWLHGNDWDADSVSNWRSYIDDLELANLCFCIWHGQYKTNLFLMDIPKLVKRLRRI